VVFSGFGSRPSEIEENSRHVYSADVLAKLSAFAVDVFEHYTPTRIMSGMGLGWEQAIALAAVTTKIPFVAILPFKDQESVWPEKSQDFYRSLLSKATDVVHTSNGTFTGMKFVERDNWIIDHCDGVFTLFRNEPPAEQETSDDIIFIDVNVAKSQARKQRIIQYAEEKEKTIIDLWPNWNMWMQETEYDQYREMMLMLCE